MNKSCNAFGWIAAALLTSGVAQASLVDRGGGLVYDDVLNVTWLQDANYAMSSGYDPDGLMDWSTANAWASNLVYGGYGDWRLPKTLQPDPTCESHGSYVTAENCTGSELGQLFYVTLGNVGPSTDPINFGLINSGLFNNLQSGHGYWSETEYTIDNAVAWYFHFASGFQAYSGKINPHFAIAVRDGDVALPPTTISEPASYIIVFSGVALLGFSLRSRKQKVTA